MVLDVIESEFGGGGGNRTRVRKSSALGSTCVAGSFGFNLESPIGRVLFSDLK